MLKNIFTTLVAYVLSACAFLQKEGYRLAAALWVFCCLAGSCLAQEAALHKIVIPANALLTDKYQEVKEANLSITGVNAITQGSDGTVWLSTQNDGLAAYTGNNIHRYRHNPKDENALPGNSILEVMEENPRLLWITTTERIVRFNRLTNQFIRYPINSRYVSKLPDGALYTTVIGKGLFRIDTATQTLQPVQGRVVSSEGKLYRGESIQFINRMATAADGTVWALAKTRIREGLFRLNLKAGQWVFYAPHSFHAQQQKEGFVLRKTANLTQFSTTALHVDDDGKVWFGGWSNGLFCFEPKTGRWHQYLFFRQGQKTASAENVILRIEPLSDNEWWISSYFNGYVFNRRKEQAYDLSWHGGKNAAPQLRAGTLFALTDHNGNRWLAGERGVYKHHPIQNYFAAVQKEKLPVAGNQLLTAFYQLGPAHYLLGIGYPDATTDNFKTETAVVKNGRLLRRLTFPKEKDVFWPQQFLPAGKDAFYYCAQRLHRLNLHSGRLQTIPVSITNEPTYQHEDYYNNILWNDSTLFSCRRTTGNAGLVKVNLRTGEARVYKTHSGVLSDSLPQDNSILRIMRDSYGRIWCAASGGVDLFYPEKELFEHYTPIEGDSTSLLGIHPRFCEGPDRTFYIVSQSGVCATKALPGKKASFKHLAYLNGAWISIDKKGMLWVGTEKGVARLNPATKEYKIYSEKDGYRWHPMRKPHQLDNGFFAMHDGTIIDPAAVGENNFKPVPRLADFWVAGQPYDLDTAVQFKQHIQLQHNENFFSFRYTCNNYIGEEDNRYRYQLKGVDNAWVEAGTRTEAFYTALKPGRYDFFVQAANNDGVWGSAKKLITITIVPAWYQTAWFKAALVLLVLVLVFTFYRQRMLHLQAKLLAGKQRAELARQEAEVKQLRAEFEKQLAQTEMAALRSQMNPHFIFNCLNSIKLYTLQNNTEAATEYLGKFSRLIRLVLENSRTTTIPLHAELEYLQLYLEMEKMRFKQKLHYTIGAEEGLDTEFIEIPPLLLQPYVENAIWHGLMHKEEGGEIALHLSVQEEALLVITITDNGIGRTKAAELKSKGATARKSFGMKMTSERIALINKLYKTETAISIRDLVDSEGEPAGTEVTIKIPLHDTPSNGYRR